ncbi:CorA family metal ion transporter [Cordyceps fumosorosea ARSEF 2679]|uniref:CorA family metal ion transporter n=1 Tax=Cordyceps fumosorosea (strain ARSEF 2679) TaxID=1081104 RepID=A0A167ZJF6_CORFA|nr:CorA family metal ion transporter [Cordyceps fumosorosea ARSEF 2679]OAA67589.1 CorA family metal ion transporter [Cordyceps fumosorosea ARSEF 2679]
MAGNRFKPLFDASASNPPAPAPAPTSAPAGSVPGAESSATAKPARPPRKRKGHRGGKNKRNRRKSFALLHDDSHDETDRASSADGFYNHPQGNLSAGSVDSEILLDHREHTPMRVRRSSTIAPDRFQNPLPSASSRLRSVQTHHSSDRSGPTTPWDETAPLLSDSGRFGPAASPSYGGADSRTQRSKSRRSSIVSSTTKLAAAFGRKDPYHVNNPPSVPGSPTFGTLDHHNEMTFGDVMLRDEMAMRAGSPKRPTMDDQPFFNPEDGHRHDSINTPHPDAEADVCFPTVGMSELGDDEGTARGDGAQHKARRRRRHWPDLSVLEEWRHFEKEDRSEERRAKRITEPQLINGRLRPVRKGWFQTDEEVPYRFTYFNEEFQSTIHSHTISELVQPGGTFRELFIPDHRILSDDESDSGDDTTSIPSRALNVPTGLDSDSRRSTRQHSVSESARGAFSPPRFAPPTHTQPLVDTSTRDSSRAPSVRAPLAAAGELRNSDSTMFKPLPEPLDLTLKPERPVRYGDRPVWWLNVVCPTEEEMKVISKAFGIHPLTAEDIMVQEAREKVELFRHYYFVNYRTFDQDINSDNFLEPVNMYVVVFREGVLSFQFSMTPHPANVRRRIRQLRDYLLLSSDWISYAIIDDITDVFQPLIQNIEDEVDEIDEAILRLHSPLEDADEKNKDDTATITDTSGDMLRRVGDCRKRVMSLYRLLGNKADVIKGFAKRCNERWEVAPKSEIGLYLGDIQDHIVTMTSNLSHYEKILARAHGNYLAQINIRMNERQEQTADVLGRLSVIGTIVLPMNIITGLWGMNVWVPGQEYEGNLQWFMFITAGLLCFGIACYLLAKRVYKIV